MPSLLSSLHRFALIPAALATVATTQAAADNWAPNLTATAAWHSNATYADRSSDQFESLQLNADILAGRRYPFGRDDALVLTGHFAGDWWPRYNDLTRGAAGGRAEWRHQFRRNEGDRPSWSQHRRLGQCAKTLQRFHARDAPPRGGVVRRTNRDVRFRCKRDID